MTASQLYKKTKKKKKKKITQIEICFFPTAAIARLSATAVILGSVMFESLYNAG